MSQVKGLCVMDVDGTLILEEVIDLLGREAGCEEEIAQLTSQAMRGELDFERSLRDRVSFLEGLPISVFDTVFNSIHLSPNAQEFISILQKNGILCAKEVLKQEIPNHVDKRDFLEVLPLIGFLE